MNIAVLRRPIEFVRARRPFHGLEVRDGVGLFPGFPERLRAAAGLSAHPCCGRGCPRAPANTKMMDGAAYKTQRSPPSPEPKITPKSRKVEPETGEERSTRAVGAPRRSLFAGVLG